MNRARAKFVNQRLAEVGKRRKPDSEVYLDEYGRMRSRHTPEPRIVVDPFTGRITHDDEASWGPATAGVSSRRPAPLWGHLGPLAHNNMEEQRNMAW